MDDGENGNGMGNDDTKESGDKGGTDDMSNTT